jgi:hypothetical protein
MLPSEPVGKPEPWVAGQTALYHITHIRNLASIVSCGRLDCDRRCARDGRAPVSIAYAGLKEKRAEWDVTVAAGGTLADYVPFYYAPRSPMLFVNSCGSVAGAPGGQESIVHLVSSVELLAQAGRFVVTDGHPIGATTEQFDDLAGLERVDWSVMPLTWWNDTDEDGDRKRRRQAEFLVHESVPLSAIRLVGVIDSATANEAATILANLDEPPSVRVRTDWYY